MKKIISLFKRNYETDYKVRNEVVEGAEWVLAGEGVATRKFDGTCCLIKDGSFFKRYEIKKGRKAPDDFLAANPVDPKTGKQQGWVPVTEAPQDQYHREAFNNLNEKLDGTYELIGEKVQGNPEGINGHILVPHGLAFLESAPRDYEGLRKYLGEQEMEGIVWHHSDGRMVKVKKKDFPLTQGANPQ